MSSDTVVLSGLVGLFVFLEYEVTNTGEQDRRCRCPRCAEKTSAGLDRVSRALRRRNNPHSALSPVQRGWYCRLLLHA
jgi:hypothetical protein